MPSVHLPDKVRPPPGGNDPSVLFGSIAKSAATLEAYQDQCAVTEAGWLIQEMRESAGLSLEELAAKLNIPLEKLAQFEDGGGDEGPTFTLLGRIARICGRTLNLGLEARQSGSTDLRAALTARLEDLGETQIARHQILREIDGFEKKLIGRLNTLNGFEIAGVLNTLLFLLHYYAAVPQEGQRQSFLEHAAQDPSVPFTVFFAHRG